MFLQHSISVQKARRKVFATLKVLESLSYSCVESEKLQALDLMLKNVEDSFRSSLPHQDGLLLRPAVLAHTVAAARKVSQKYRRLQLQSAKYGSLPLHKRAHKGMKGEWKHKNRVGKKANEYKKVRAKLFALMHNTLLHYMRRFVKSC